MRKSLWIPLLALICFGPGICLASDLEPAAAVELPMVDAGLVEGLPAVLATGDPTACSVSTKKPPGVTAERASCSADCGASPDVSCSAPGTCTAVDRNCANGQQGYVSCSSGTTYCPACQCTNGQVRYISSSQCCCDYTVDWKPRSRKKVIKQTCVNGNWTYSGFSCSGANCPGICPL